MIVGRNVGLFHLRIFVKVCRTCKKEIPKKYLVRNGAYGGFQNICRLCKRKEALEYAKKKREMLKEYRSYWSDED